MYIRTHKDCKNVDKTHVSSSQKNLSTEKGSRHEVPTLVLELLTIGSYWEKESQFFLKCMAPDKSTTLQWIPTFLEVYAQKKKIDLMDLKIKRTQSWVGRE